MPTFATSLKNAAHNHTQTYTMPCLKVVSIKSSEALNTIREENRQIFEYMYRAYSLILELGNPVLGKGKKW